MDEVGILSIHVEDIFEHAENQTGDSEDFRKRAEADFLWDGYE